MEIDTEMGMVVVELSNETPVHRDNFVKSVKEGAYDGLLFHQVVPGFMVQGGDPDSRNATAEMILGENRKEESLPAEITPGLVHKRGALSAARHAADVEGGDRSSASRFFIVQGRKYQPADLERVEERNARFGQTHTFTDAEAHVYATLGGAPHLDGGYTVFGQVVEGMHVIDAIAMMPADNNGRPLKDIRMVMRLK